MKIVETLTHEIELGEADALEVVKQLEDALEAARAMAERGVERIRLGSHQEYTQSQISTDSAGTWTQSTPTGRSLLTVSGTRDTSPAADPAPSA